MTDGNTSSTPTASRANTFPWPPVLLALALVGAWLLGRMFPLAWPGVDDRPARLIGIGFGIAGVGLLFWSIRSLSRAGTTVMPHGTSSALVTSGPYARFRNPIYIADVLVLLCIAELTKNIWLVAAAVLFVPLVTVLQIIPEERHLAGQFGEAYEAYRAQTRRWI
jgi:protein-S-isoprenylcysteine O-methyltransferase Ste14